MKKQFSKVVSGLTAVATVGTMLLTVAPVKAASFTAISDTMTRVAVSTTADHTIVLTLPTGINFDVTGNTDVLVYDFPHTSGFTQGGTWATTDFTFNDGTARTIDAVDAGAGTTTVSCSDGANNVGVAIDTTAIAFRVIPCGASFTASSNAATVTFTIDGTTAGGTLTNPSAAASYALAMSMTDEGSAAAHSGSTALGIADSDQVSVTATVDPTLTFDLDASTSDSNNNAPYSVALGTLTTGAVASSNGSINSIWVDLATNAGSGAVVTVLGANGASGLVSASVPAHTIPSSTATLVAGTEGFGICVETNTATTGTLTDVSPFNGSCDTTTNHAVGGITTSAQNILNSASAPIAGGRAKILVKAAISAVTEAHADYAETLTFVATATF